MTRIFLLRHGESAAPNVFHGAESDIGLSPRGVAQAHAVAQVLATHHPDALVSSGMRRAIDTATPIAVACRLDLGMEPDLHERRVGSLSGTSFHAKDGVWPETLRRWMAGELAYAPTGAESFSDIRDRVLPVWHRLADAHAGKTLVIVAHGVVCKVIILSLVEGMVVGDWQRLGPIDNVALNELVQQGGVWRAVRLNDSSATKTMVPPAVSGGS